MNRIIVVVLVSNLLLSACSIFPSNAPRIFPTSSAPDATALNAPSLLAIDVLTPVPLHIGRAVHGPWFDIYFTDPSDPASLQMDGGVDGILVEAIDAAHLSVDLAMYSLSLRDVSSALIRAHRRGINVRIVMESDNMDGEIAQSLKDSGIPVLGDRRESLMHNKFMVIDRLDVWTGSMNYTYSGAYSDDNNVIRLRSTAIAEDYEAEFEEMFVKDWFGSDVGGTTPKPDLVVDSTPVQVYFSPDDHILPALVKLLDSASSSIDFLAFSFTSNEMGDALLRASESGIAVSGVMDADQAGSNSGGEWPSLRSAGLDVRLDGNPGQMHDKVLIIDKQIVVLGSYNFTRSAEESNDENLVVIHDPAIAGQYQQEFQRIYSLAKP